MAKFSVKKPLTIFVAVIAIIVLGVVAFTSMTPDLLPNIDMPYIMLITPYPGSTPEKVEKTVTKPLEQQMATLENIKNIQSVSNANYSRITLEFTPEVNMDTITVDILQRVNQVQPGWDDMVGAPVIMKLNPSMIPVMVAAVNMDGMDTTQLSTVVDNTILGKLEGIDGVASIQTSGMLEEKIHVMLSQGKIDALNERVQAAVSGQFAEKEAELEKARGELQADLDELQAAAAKLQDGMTQLAQKSADGEAQLNEKQMQLMEGKLMITQQLIVMKTLQGELQTNLQQLTAVRNQYNALLNTKNQLEAARAMWVGVEASLNAAQPFTPEQEAFIVANGLDPSTITVVETAQKIAELDFQIAAVQGGIAQMEAALAAQGITPAELDNVIAEIETTINRLNTEMATLQQTLAKLETGETTLEDAMRQLSVTKSTTQFQLSSSAAQIIAGQASLNMALKQVESGIEQLQEAKENALRQARLDKIVTMENVAGILRAQNFSMPAGYVQEGPSDILVSVGDEVASLKELTMLVLVDLDIEGLEPIYLDDVADVYMADNSNEVYAKINGSDAVLLTFSKQSTYATATVSDNIRAKFSELEAANEGLHFYTMMDQGDYIYMVVESILSSLLWGALFAVIILALFLKDLRPTFITLCSIPISVVFAIALMYFSGVTINIISLSGLAVAVGMLVDNSVVVIENIYRLRSLGVPAARAAVAGANQVAGAITSSTLTTVCVFLPIVFVQGLTRDLFTDMALTIGYSLLASLIVALTLVPAMSSKLLVNAQPKESRWLAKAMKGYEAGLKWTLHHKAITLLATVLLLAASVLLVLARGFTFMPDMTMAQLTVNVELPKDSALEDVMSVTDTVQERIAGIDGVGTTGAMIGGTGAIGLNLGGGGARNSATIYVLLNEEAQTRGKAISKEIMDITADLPAEVTASGSSGLSTALVGGSGVEVRLYGNNLNDLQSAARQTADMLRQLPGTGEVSDGVGDTSPELRFVVNRGEAARYGLTTAQVFAEINKALTNQKASTSLMKDGNEYEIVVLAGDTERLTPGFIRSHRFTVTNRAGDEEEIALSDVTSVVETESKTAIQRDGQRRTITVSATIAEGHNVSLVTTQAEQAMAKQQLPEGIKYEFSGENTSIMDSFWELGKMLALGVLLVYLIMVAQFQSLISPFIVMFTIPLAFTGGFLGLLVTGKELSVIALIGFVMLVGIIVNNGIVLVDYINQMRAEGTPRDEAIVQAGIVRMRPILMTSITTILGLSMMAVGSGLGSELMQPVAIVCIGGLSYATLLTLFIIPVMYDILNRREIVVLTDDDLKPVEE